MDLTVRAGSSNVGPAFLDEDFLSQTFKMRPKLRDTFEYDTELQIGRGAYGNVYKIFSKNIDERNNRKEYAMKAIAMLPYSSSTCRELAIFRETNHRNVMSLLHVYFAILARRVCLIFDYAEYDLNIIIRHYRRSNMPTQLIKSCFHQVILGVEYLHTNWILHRDLKPDNILVMAEGPERGCVKITDLGMARTFNAPLRPLADVDFIVVTTWYRAPELLLSSRHYTKAIDVFSIGCIFAELLTGAPIFYCPAELIHPSNRSPYQRNQLDRMFKVMGFPTVKDWPELIHMPRFPTMMSAFNTNRFRNANLMNYMADFDIYADEASFQLLETMLFYNPENRSTLQNALKHSYFQEEPAPTADVFAELPVLPFPKRAYLEPKPPVKGKEEPTLQQIFE